MQKWGVPGKKLDSSVAVKFNDLTFEKSDFNRGWMETDVFNGWIANRFLNQIPPLPPIVLLLDGHESHIDIQVSEICPDN